MRDGDILNRKRLCRAIGVKEVTKASPSGSIVANRSRSCRMVIRSPLGHACMRSRSFQGVLLQGEDGFTSASSPHGPYARVGVPPRLLSTLRYHRSTPPPPATAHRSPDTASRAAPVRRRHARRRVGRSKVGAPRQASPWMRCASMPAMGAATARTCAAPQRGVTQRPRGRHSATAPRAAGGSAGLLGSEPMQARRSFRAMMAMVGCPRPPACAASVVTALVP